VTENIQSAMVLSFQHFLFITPDFIGFYVPQGLERDQNFRNLAMQFHYRNLLSM
jgi:hypothetical protein